MGHVCQNLVVPRASQTFTFRSRPTASAFDRFEDYLRTRTEGVDRTIFELIRKRDREMGTGSDRIPWPTFILGSGCLLTLAGHSGGITADIEPLLEASFDGLPTEVAKRSDVFLGGLGSFLVELNQQKFGPNADLYWLVERWEELPDRSRSESDFVLGGTHDVRFAVRTALVAFLATRLYTEALNAASFVLDRAEKDEVAYSLATHPAMRAVHAAVVAPLRAITRSMHAHWERNRGKSDSLDAYHALLAAFIGHLSDDGVSTVHRSHVEVLSAFAWFFLTDDTDIYPGWSDTLLFQATDMKDSGEHFASMPVPRRPRLETVSPLDETSWLYRRLRRVTTRSWQEVATDRDNFYDSVAELLIQQTEMVRAATREHPRDASWPIASAFIASFDVELEIALLSRHDLPDTGIAVVIPVVHIADSLDYNTTIHWLARVIEPTARNATIESKLANLLDGDGWQTVGASGGDIDRFRGMPVVVHLSGAPLFRLPGEERDILRGGELRHALLLDENIALIQLSAEIAEHGRSLNPGFGADPPFTLSGDQSRPGPGLRYWFMVGTQVADSSVRLRLLTREIAAIRDPGVREQRLRKLREFAPGVEVTERLGVVINETVPTSERQVFLWQGFDVIRGTSGELTPQIRRLSEETARLANRAGTAPVGYSG